MTRQYELIYGFHAVEAALKSAPGDISEIWLSNEDRARSQAIIEQAAATGISLSSVARGRLDQLAGHTKHQGVIARRRHAAELGERDLQGLIDQCREQAPLLLILDRVQDPHNLGACIRTAEAVGATAVIITKDQSASLTPAARKAAAGAAETLPVVRVTNLARAIKDLKRHGVWVMGTSDQAEDNIYAADLSGPMALVMGNEAEGMRRLTGSLCDFTYRIPITGRVSSLNVSVAAGICLYEAFRQRREKQIAG